MSKTSVWGYQGYRKGCERIASLPIYIEDYPKYDLVKLGSLIDLMIKKHGIKIMFLDYLTLLEGSDSDTSLYQKVSDISAQIKRYGREFNIPIVVLSQLSRGVESRKNKRPQLSDLRESGAIEQDADIVMFCYQPSRYGEKVQGLPEGKEDRLFELIVAKQRDGPTGIIPFYYERERNFFAYWEVKIDYQSIYNMNGGGITG